MTKVFAFFGVITVFILTLLTGGLGLIVLLLMSENFRDFLAKVISEFIEKKVYGSPDWEAEEAEAQAEWNDFFSKQEAKNED